MPHVRQGNTALAGRSCARRARRANGSHSKARTRAAKLHAAQAMNLSCAPRLLPLIAYVLVDRAVAHNTMFRSRALQGVLSAANVPRAIGATARMQWHVLWDALRMDLWNVTQPSARHARQACSRQQPHGRSVSAVRRGTIRRQQHNTGARAVQKARMQLIRGCTTATTVQQGALHRRRRQQSVQQHQ